RWVRRTPSPDCDSGRGSSQTRARVEPTSLRKVVHPLRSVDPNAGILPPRHSQAPPQRRPRSLLSTVLARFVVRRVSCGAPSRIDPTPDRMSAFFAVVVFRSLGRVLIRSEIAFRRPPGESRSGAFEPTHAALYFRTAAP